MVQVLKREAAKRDLIAQWVWYAENASIDVANRFLTAADNTLNLLATQPESGRLFVVHERELHGIRSSGNNRLTASRFHCTLYMYKVQW